MTYEKGELCKEHNKLYCPKCTFKVDGIFYSKNILPKQIERKCCGECKEVRNGIGTFECNGLCNCHQDSNKCEEWICLKETGQEGCLCPKCSPNKCKVRCICNGSKYFCKNGDSFKQEEKCFCNGIHKGECESNIICPKPDTEDNLENEFKKLLTDLSENYSITISDSMGKQEILEFIAQQIAKAEGIGFNKGMNAVRCKTYEETKAEIIELLKPILEIEDYKDGIEAWNNTKDLL